MEPLIEFVNVSFDYDRTTALRNATFSIYNSQLLSILGPNGGGKSTIIKLILGFEQPSAGYIKKQSLLNIAYVQQNIMNNKEFPITVTELINMSNNININKQKKTVELMNIGKLLNKRIANLSGGELQRCIITRALSSNYDILIMDEPTSSLDVEKTNILYKIIKDEVAEGKAVCIVSHDVCSISNLSSSTILVNRDIATIKRKITNDDIREFYGTELDIMHSNNCENNR